MTNTARNIYKSARVFSGFETKKASSLLGFDERTLRNYENGTYDPSNETVLKMMQIYGTKWLGYLHLRTSELGRQVLPEIQLKKGFASSVLTLQRTVRVLTDTLNELSQIAEDDALEGEEEVFQKVCKKIEANVSACMGILVNEFKKAKAQKNDPSNGN